MQPNQPNQDPNNIDADRKEGAFSPPTPSNGLITPTGPSQNQTLPPQQLQQNTEASGSLADPTDHAEPPMPPIQTPVAGPVIGGMGNFPPAKPARRKKLVVLIASVVVIAFGAAGFIFAYYLPNRPENVWKTGLTRTGDELDAFIEKLADPATFDTLAKNKVKITGKIDTKSTDVHVNFDSVFDEKASDSSISVQAENKDEPEKIDIDALIKTQIVEGSVWPNMYLNVSGLSTLGADAFMPGISGFDGKWIAFEQDYYDELLSDADAEDASEQNNVTQQDVTNVLKDFSAVTRDYVFTTDQTKAVLMMQEFVGVEESEGLKANHYKVTLHEDHAVAYCKALVDKMYASASYKKIFRLDDKNLNEDIESAKKTCEPPKNDEDAYAEYKSTFDIWVDKKYKLVHKLRLTSDLEKRAERIKKQKQECMDRTTGFSGSSNFCDYYDEQTETGESYFEFGQVYSGSDEMHLFVNNKNETNKNKDHLRADLTVKLEGLLLNGKITYASDSKDDKASGELTISTEPYDGKIDASKPAGAIPIKDVYQQLQNGSQNQNGSQLGVSSDDSAQHETLLSRMLSVLLRPLKSDN